MSSNAPWAPQFTNRIRLADVNGSGSRDILWGDAGHYRYLDLTGGIKPRLLTRVYNGLGGVTEIQLVSQNSGASSEAPAASPGPSARA